MSFNSSMQQLFAGLGSSLAGIIVVSDASHRLSHYEWVGYCSAAIIAVCLLLARRLGVR
jgi:predicted MFS family arabinose efflux permease